MWNAWNNTHSNVAQVGEISFELEVESIRQVEEFAANEGAAIMHSETVFGHIQTPLVYCGTSTMNIKPAI
jgi:hypothetical protein